MSKIKALHKYICNMQKQLKFQSKLDVLQTRFPLILNQVVEYTILEKTNPGVSQYETLLQGSTAELHSQTLQLKQMSTTINEILSQISIDLDNINKNIKYETKREKNIEHQLSQIVLDENGSQILVGDYKTLLTNQRVQNVLTTLIIIASAAKLSKLLTSTTTIT
jgi:uncharacterized protein YukE